ncbi:MAG: hypothetical protein J7647_29260 [Cyanobacteria bacterium SBLK]|nr:hypothetical protein [Cyanobacteria bacterium SBLK]
MKCINCGIDNNLKERTQNQGRCKRCGHQFVFDSKIKPAFSDLFFKNTLALLSTKNNYFFTRKQFFYFLENEISQKSSNKRDRSIDNFFMVFVALDLLIYTIIVKNFGNIDVDFEKFTIIFFCVYWLSWFRFSTIKSNSEEQLSKTRKKYAKLVRALGIIAVLFAIYCFFRISFIFSLIIAGIGCFVIYIAGQNLRNQDKISTVFPLQSRDFNHWLDRWSQVNGRLEKLLPHSREESATTPVSPEISSYSFDRVVICDRDEIAQFLIANNFHFDYHCAILSVTGYPQAIFDSLLEMLKRNPNLTVYTLHDASPRGIDLTYRVQNTPQWFGDLDVAVYDAGLRPSHVLNGKNLFVQNSSASQQQAREISTEIRQILSAKELAWLEQGNFVELESFTPQKLLKILAKTLDSNQNQWKNESSSSDYSDGSTEVIFYSSDTFG